MILEFVRCLKANPDVSTIRDEFDPDEEKLEAQEVNDFAEYLGEHYGLPFPLPIEDRQLVGFPRYFDIAWNSAPGHVFAGGAIELLTGCINLRNLSVAFSEPTHERESYSPTELAAEPLLRIATVLDAGSAVNVTKYLTYILYDRPARMYQGLVILYNRRFWHLSLSLGEYVRTALAWHGGWGWQFLYLSIEDFCNLDNSTLLTIYNLCEGLPELFPDANWDIIADKQNYFDYARQFARQ